MNKIDFPLGVELPLRGGQSAVLHEFFEGRWYGRVRGRDKWYGEDWEPCGAIDLKISPHGRDILWPPKRKVWVMWGSGENISMCFTHQSAADLAHRYQGTIQEIEEP